MAIFLEYTPELQKQWDEWVASRPAVIQEMCKKVQANRLYRLKTTNQHVVLSSFNENGTVTVQVLAEFNPRTMRGLAILNREVFGIAVDDLEECDLPEGWTPSQ